MDFILACLPWWGAFMAAVVVFVAVLKIIQHKRDLQLKRKWLAERDELGKAAEDVRH